MIPENAQSPEKPIYKLTREQFEIYCWLKKQGLNTDDETLNYWSRKYPVKRIFEVVMFAKSRRNSGQSIRNIGGWIHKILKTDAPVVNDESQSNREYAKRFMETKRWNELKIYEKYVRDEVTGDDLPLTRPSDDFKREIESLYQRSLLYRNL
jgi:hypothetical protein